MTAPDLLDRFAAIVGARHALRDPAETEPFVTERRGLWPGATPLVLRPGSVAEVSAILKLASETGTPVVPQGGNTGLVGGQVPDMTGSEVVLSLSRLAAIREIDTASNAIVAEAGVTLPPLPQAAEAPRRLFPLSLAPPGTAQIRGNPSPTAGAARELSDSCAPTSTAPDVWYRWVAPCNGSARIDTCGSAFDTVLSLHTGANCATLTQVACSDNSLGECGGPSAQAAITAPITAGTTYFIRVTGNFTASGTFTLLRRRHTRGGG